VPLNASVAAGGDAGVPIALDELGALAEVFAAIAERVVTEVSPLVEMAGCSARLLERVEKALGPVGP
jgi:ATP-binding protein involved in chromosome partitioning